MSHVDRQMSRKIREMVRRIRLQFDPVQIILFGSCARGTATRDSDVDLLVVMPVLEPKRDLELRIRMALRGIGAAKDVVVTSPEDFSWRRDVPGTIEHPASREGKILYARR